MSDEDTGSNSQSSGDAFDNLVLDDSFVKEAKISELRVAKKQRRKLRGSRRRASISLFVHKLGRRAVPVVTVLALLIGLGFAGIHWNNARQQNNKASQELAAAITGSEKNKSSNSSSTSSSLSTTSTSVDFTLSRYMSTPGDCANWNQDNKAGEHTLHVVTCDQPHIYEFAKATTIDDNNVQYPSDDQWERMEHTLCDPLLTAYLGYPLDAHGKFSLSTIQPTAQGWIAGDRTMDCGIGEGSRDFADIGLPTGKWLTLSGSIKGQDQTLVYDAGTCIHVTNDIYGTVSCDQPHQNEIAGSVSIPPSIKSLPQSADQWDSAIGSACERVDRSYLKHTPPAGSEGWFILEQSSWDAGERTVNCVLSHGHDDMLTGSFRDGTPTIVP